MMVHNNFNQNLKNLEKIFLESVKTIGQKKVIHWASIARP